MGTTTQPEVPDVPDVADDPPVAPWVEWVTVGLGAVMGFLLLLMAFDAARRIVLIDREYADLTQGSADVSSVPGESGV